MGGMSNAQKLFIKKPEGKRTHGGPKVERRTILSRDSDQTLWIGNWIY
jgi:hypothetical protein